MTELTQKELKELAYYNPETGGFTSLISIVGNIEGFIPTTITDCGYLQVKINNKKYYAERLAFLYMDGKFPEVGLQVEHVNHNRRDNRWSNLRLVTHKETIERYYTSLLRGDML